jgi:hypothetical protein
MSSVFAFRLKSILSCLAVAALALVPSAPLRAADYDHSRYIGPDELRPGMKGYGRTVMSGSKIETFQFEVITVMKNAFNAQQDVILVRCSGLNLEHSGIIGGMSGSPCYIVDEATGQPRMMGAIAFGWSFNKDPIGGVQPITQMLPIPELRAPKDVPATQPAITADAGAGEARSEHNAGIPIAELVARHWAEPIDEASPLSVLNEDLRRLSAGKEKPEPMSAGLQPLPIPLMVSGGERAVSRMRKYSEHFGFEPVSSGGASSAAREAAGDVKLEPGSALIIPMMTGDMMMEGLGTCTEVIGNRVLGFGHSMDAKGNCELPLATGIVHTVIPSVQRSVKLGAAIETVGTLYGDENTGVFGLVGKPAAMIPMEVVVHDLRGTQTYHFNLAHDPNYTPMLLMNGAQEAVYAHSEPPEEHTIKYAVEVEYEGLGTFRSANFTSQRGVAGPAMDLMMPAMSLMDTPFGKAKVTRAKAEITIEKGARAATMDEVILPKMIFKPGEKVEARVRWMHYRSTPQYTHAAYTLELPNDLPDGEYELSVCSPRAHLAAMRSEKPHLFRADNLQDLLEGFNRLTGCPDNGVYLRLALPKGGFAVKQTELPELPSFRRQILADSRRTDITRFSEVKAVRFDTDFAVTGDRDFRIRVSRRADQ